MSYCCDKATMIKSMRKKVFICLSHPDHNLSNQAMTGKRQKPGGRRWRKMVKNADYWHTTMASTQLRVTFPVQRCPTVGWVLPHQSSIKNHPHAQTCLRMNLMKAFSQFRSLPLQWLYLCQVDKKVTSTNPTQSQPLYCITHSLGSPVDFL